MQNYQKPAVTDLGTLRALTQYGLDSNCDGGGIFGPVGDGTWVGCTRSS